MTPELPSDPWHLLGLDPLTATERGVKSSYAKLLKRYKPDQFPAEFQKVRTAYEAALRELTDGPAQPPPLPAPSPEAFSEAPSETDEFQQTLHQLSTSLGNPADVPQQRRLFEKLFHDFPKVKNGPERWLSMLDQLFEQETHTLAQLVTPEQLLTLLEFEDVSTFCTVILVWKGKADINRLTAAAQLMLRTPAQPQSPATAIAICRFANILAVHRADLAHRLLNQCFPHLPTGQRPRLAATVEARIGIGKILYGMPPVHQSFWEQCLCEPDRTIDWSTTRAQNALQHLQGNYGHGWHGFQLLQPLLPPEEQQRLANARERMSTHRPFHHIRPSFRNALLRWGSLALGLACLLRGCAPTFQKWLD